MKYLRYPFFNGAFISLFSSFYAFIFIFTSNHIEFQNILYYTKAKAANSNNLSTWGEFLYNGNQKYIGMAMIALTVLIVILLASRKTSYDEYHVAILSNYLLIAGFITICLVAILFFLILSEPMAIVEKITLFVILHWMSILVANLIFIIAYRAK